MRTGELAAASGLTAKTRDYPPQAAHRLAFIRDAQSAGLTLAEIRSILTMRDSGEPPCTHVADLIEQRLADIERRMAELRKTRTALRGLAERAAVTDPSTCAQADICRIIAAPAPTDNKGLSPIS
ncbi:MerR family DNA-binding protein [Streptomyces sp. NPDC057611]|uniref:MerR family DNA-binding protein n=1 Tax=Streptomyces sp. NPDC057611 TaxID=3346182 RepID=UPI003693657B